MPILYPIATYYFVSTYFLEKYLIFNYHKKSTKFNEQLPLYSLHLFKWPIVFHCLISLLNFSSGQIFYNADISFSDFGLNTTKLE